MLSSLRLCPETSEREKGVDQVAAWGGVLSPSKFCDVQRRHTRFPGWREVGRRHCYHRRVLAGSGTPPW
jgi:hypothetical protein